MSDLDFTLKVALFHIIIDEQILAVFIANDHVSLSRSVFIKSQ